MSGSLNWTQHLDETTDVELLGVGENILCHGKVPSSSIGYQSTIVMPDSIFFRL